MATEVSGVNFGDTKIRRGEAGAEAERGPAGALGQCGDHDLGRAHDLDTARVVLADPGLREPQAVHLLDELEVVLQRQRRVEVDQVERAEEGSELHCWVLVASALGSLVSIVSDVVELLASSIVHSPSMATVPSPVTIS